MIYVILFILVVYFVGFSSATFSGSEGSTSSVSLFVLQPAPFDITLTLRTMDISAMCKRLIFWLLCTNIYDVFIPLVGADYFFNDEPTNPDVTVTIPMGSTTHDVVFTVRNDSVIEIDESFQLQILLSAQSVVRDVLLAGSETAIVTLQDDQTFSKFIPVKYSNKTL